MQTLITLHPLSPNWKPWSFSSTTSSSSPVIWKNSDRSSLRYFRQWARHANRDKILLRQFEQASSSHMHGTVPGFFSGDCGKISTGCEEIILAKHLMNKFPACYTIASGSCRNLSVKDDKALRSLKLALLLIGMLTSLGSHQAIAGTEFSGEPQLISFIGDLGDISTGFASAFLLIFFSELGDKTFFIAALLAARNSGAVVFIGTFGALAAMSIVSVILGRTFHYVDGILPFRFGETDFPIDDFAAVCLLVYFGITTLLEAASGDGLKTKEEQKEAEVAVSELSGNGAGTMAAASTVISTFLLVFVAEWGDKSFFSTIALAAASSPLGVIGGAFAGHALATLLAVVGGSILGTFVSEKVVAYIGGSLFLLFAVITLIEIIN